MGFYDTTKFLYKRKFSGDKVICNDELENTLNEFLNNNIKNKLGERFRAMREIKTKFGKLYIEDLEYDRHKPWMREEEDRIKLYDSKFKYFDYFIVTDTFTKEEYENYIRSIQTSPNIEWLLDLLGINYELVTKNKKEAQDYLDDNDIENNEWVNIIGDYYIIIAE